MKKESQTNTYKKIKIDVSYIEEIKSEKGLYVNENYKYK